MTWINYIILAAIISIWAMLLVNVILIVAGYVYYYKSEHYKFPKMSAYPMVSVLVPAHNEEKVIARTLESLLQFNYPADSYEIIVINDNSDDNSAKILNGIKQNYPNRMVTIINTDNISGGKGKSNALNIGLQYCRGRFVVIYDADNTPEKDALRYLVAEISTNEKLGAVIGKFRTRNRNANWLTRFINIETIAFQWMAQAGRWQLFNLCTIPGTNFIIRKSILDSIGGWDIHALAEDTEISFQIYRKGYMIKFLPQAVTWEQEPQTLKVWFQQRTRWVKGNIYVIIKNIPLLKNTASGKVRFDIYYMLTTYFLLLTSLIISDMLFIGNALGWIHSTLAGFSMILWSMAIILFIIGTFVTITPEKGEMTTTNFFYVFIMYFTYSKLWTIVAAYGLVEYLKDTLFKRESQWYKTERF
ncbi:MAG: glycosyltransferase [Flexilinea sp.]